MCRVDAGETNGYCDGLSRRSFVQTGLAGMGAASLGQILHAQDLSLQTGAAPKDTRVILVWLDGGPSHMDLYDLKPQAPAEYRGFWKPTPTNVSGIEISELFPRQAKVADKFSIVRSVRHDNGDHFAGAHVMLTGRWGATGADTTGRSPSIGSIATKLAGSRRKGLPAYVSVPHASSVGLRPGYFGGNYLGNPYNPFETEGDPNSAAFKVRNLQPPDALTIDRLESRRSLLSYFDRMRGISDQNVEAMNRFELEAYEMLTSAQVRQAFDLGSEKPELRDRYGRNPWGQSTLLARRLAEAGVTFTTVLMGGWDHHWDLKAGMESHLPKLDAALATLYEDLDSRGLAEKVLVVVCGEFSRTPKMNDGSGKGTPGRDHWGGAMFTILAGGGLKRGVVVGATDERGEKPVTRSISPADIHATIYHVLGVDPRTPFFDHSGRPIPVLDGGAAIAELL